MGKRPRKRRQRFPRGTRHKGLGRILVVDDDTGFLDYASRMLGTLGYDVATECSGDDALAAIERTCPDLVLCDVMMPGLNGFQLCRRVKASPAMRGTRVALMSGAASPVNRYWAELTGAATFIPKPLDRDVVLTALEHILVEVRRK